MITSTDTYNDIEEKYLFKYLRVENVSESKLGDLETMLNDEELRYFHQDDPLKSWVCFKQIVTHLMLFLSRYNYLNDPYECLVNINYTNGVDDETLIKYYNQVSSHIIERAPDAGLTFDIFKNKVQQYVETQRKHFYNPAVTDNHLPFGICSFSSEPCNIQMWSYYADNHKGLCVAFEIDWQAILQSLHAIYPHMSTNELIAILKSDGFSFNHVDNNGEVVSFGFQNVEYTDSVPDYHADKFMQAHFEESCKKDLSWLLTRAKHVGWSHENEWRLVCFNRYSSDASDLLPINFINFIKPCAIILGISMTQSVKDIVKKIYSSQYPVIELKRESDERPLEAGYSLFPSKLQITQFLNQMRS